MKQLSGLMFGIFALLIVGSPAAQTTYPEKPIRMIAGFPPGSPADILSRALGQKLTGAWGKPVVVENITGAAGNIGADRVAKAAPDGYTLGLLVQSQLVINPNLQRLPFDPVKDFAPVSQIAMALPVLVVHSALPAKNIKELIALAKAQPGDLTFASSGNGSTPHMTGELLKSVAGVDMRHIPYKGFALAMPDLIAGRVTMAFGPIAVFLPLVREGKLRAIALTSLRRSSVATELPTIAESGYPGFDVANWYGLLAPARTPATIVDKLHLEIVKALALPDLRAKLDAQGLEAVGNSPHEFAAAIKTELPKWAKVIKEAGIKPDQ